MADKIRTFLEKNNLSQYVNKFMELGYEDLKQLFDMQPEEIIDVFKEVALYDKPGHRKTKQGVQDKRTRQASVLHQCRVLPTMLQLVSIYILTCFAWRILKTKIILEKP
jgi:hypothetical protein